MSLLVDLAVALLTVLVGAVAVYFAIRLLGRIAKTVVTVLVVIAVLLILWFVFGDGVALSPFAPQTQWLKI